MKRGTSVALVVAVISIAGVGAVYLNGGLNGIKQDSPRSESRSVDIAADPRPEAFPTSLDATKVENGHLAGAADPCAASDNTCGGGGPPNQ